MRSTMIRSAVLGTVVSIGALIAPSAQSAAQDAVILRSAGIEKMMPSEKDGALREALRLLGPRIEELPQEFGTTCCEVRCRCRCRLIRMRIPRRDRRSACR